MRRRRLGLPLAGLFFVLGGFAACSTPDSPVEPDASPTVSPTVELAGGASDMARPVDSGASQWLAALDTLAVKGRAPMTGYSREEFGPDWSDVNRNGCDTRNDILTRDLSSTEVVNCVVLRGVLVDPYSGAVVPFTRGPVSSMDVQIDHVVALANAWQTGAFQWTADKRERFANDPRNLLAVRGDLNLQKGEGDTATWLPPKKSFRCEYVRRQIAVKADYRLWVTEPEREAMLRVMATC